MKTLRNSSADARWPRLVAGAIFAFVFAGHALYLRHVSRLSVDGWANVDSLVPNEWLGFQPYLLGRDYFVGFSYALGVAFAAWAITRFIIDRRSSAVEAASSITLAGGILAAGCFLIGCCGSPMLAIYLSIFGAKAIGLGKPLMALITLLAVSCAYWCMRRRSRGKACVDCCEDADPRTPAKAPKAGAIM